LAQLVQAEQQAEHAHGQERREFGHEVDIPALHRAGRELTGHDTDLRLEPAQGRRGKGMREHGAQPGMLRRILHDQRVGDGIATEPRRLKAHGQTRGREASRVAEHGDHVGVAADGPHAARRHLAGARAAQRRIDGIGIGADLGRHQIDPWIHELTSGTLGARSAPGCRRRGGVDFLASFGALRWPHRRAAHVTLACGFSF
jgi:hypothetical protein